MNELSEIIVQRIKRDGPMNFEEFMSQVLYHPELGYYCSPKEKLGFDGDFYTSCTLTPVFGFTIAAQLLEMWRMSQIKDFSIVEYGAGTGEFCAAILSFFRSQPELPGNLSYYIIEISPALRATQKLKIGPGVQWIDNIGEIAGFSGAVVSNELLDNFPVRRVVMQDELMEVVVDFENRFVERLLPAPPELRNYFSDLRIVLPKGFKTEVCLQVQPWISSIAKSLNKGFVFTIDYGYLSGDLYSPSRAGGTVVSYFQHKVVEDLYANIGRQDISAHVNFSALVLAGMHNGLLLTGFREQGPFLRALGFERLLRESRPNGASVDAVRHEDAVAQVILGEMGSKFKVLVQHKGLERLPLSGFRIDDL